MAPARQEVVVDELIFHLAEPEAWRRAQAAGTYVAPSLAEEGFIHLSRADQLIGTANRYYAGRTDLVLLVVRAAALGAALQLEPSTGGALFPHCYGPLPLAAVHAALAWQPDADGVFRQLPRGSSPLAPRRPGDIE